MIVCTESDPPWGWLGAAWLARHLFDSSLRMRSALPCSHVPQPVYEDQENRPELVNAIKNCSVGRPGNEAGCNVRITLLVLCNIRYPVRCRRLDSPG